MAGNATTKDKLKRDQEREVRLLTSAATMDTDEILPRRGEDPAPDLEGNGRFVMDEEDVAEDVAHNAYREAAIRAKEFYDGAFAFIAGYDGSKAFAFDCAMLGLGKGELIGCQSAVQLGERYHRTKAAVTKCIKRFQDACGVPPMPGQRSESARRKFARVRVGQLKRI